MYTLACKDVGIPTCSFVAKGKTTEEVISTLNEHAMKAHAEEIDEYLKKMSKEDLNKIMADKIVKT